MPAKRSSRVSLRDVAQECGVSTMAVSLALRGSGRVPASTARRIRETALRLGYMPDPKLSVLMAEMARTRHHAQSGVLAFMNTGATEGFRNEQEAKQHQAAVERAKLYGYKVERFWLTDPALPASRLNQILWSRGIEGIIIPNISGQLYARGVHTLPIEWDKFCVIEIGGSMLKPAVNRVRHDHYEAMIKAVHRLTRLGYRRLGLCMSREVDLRTHHRWTAAYLIWQRFWPDAADIRPLLFDEIDPAHIAAWAHGQRLDVILSPGFQALHALRAGGFDVPGEIGFASLHIFGSEASDLSGVDQDAATLMSLALDNLVHLIQKRERGVPEHPTEVLSTGHWQEGHTVRCQEGVDTIQTQDLEEQILPP